MNSRFQVNYFVQSVGLIFLVGATSAFAQSTFPNAGSLSTTPTDPVAAPAKSPTFEVQQEIRPALVVPGGVKVKALTFKTSGNTVFSDATLTELLHGLVGQSLDQSGLNQAADIISKYYRQHGYFVARAYFPAQEMSSGNLEIAVIEGRLGAVKFNRGDSTRVSEERAKSLIAGASPPGSAINEKTIERGLMLLNDLPGVEVKSTLIPGATPGTSDLVVETMENRLVTGSLDADNFGNKYTGSIRIGGTVNLNDLLGIGDQLIVRGLSTGSGMNYGRLAYSAPVGNVGTKLGVAFSTMDYKLGKDFAPLDANGKFSVTSLFGVQPFIRSRNNNLYGTLSYDSKRMSDEQVGINVTDKKVGVLAFGLSGDTRDAWGGGGLNAGSLTFTQGNLNVGSNAAYAANDGLTARTGGSYSKINYSASRLQSISDDWSFYTGLTGQGASKNLDSSEKFVLGGVGVRAYPQGEAAGDSGVLLNLEARYNVPGFDFAALQLIGFIDTGSVMLHKSTWAGWQPVGIPGFPNRYSLSGAGVGLNVFKGSSYSIRSSLAWKLGSNPGRDVLDHDSDNESRSVRFWMQLNKQF